MNFDLVMQDMLYLHQGVCTLVFAPGFCTLVLFIDLAQAVFGLLWFMQ